MADRVESVTQRSARLRCRFITAVVILIEAGLAARLVNVQVQARDRLDDRARRQHARGETLPARPGEILDVRGRLLATSVDTASLFANPKAIANKRAVAESLAVAVGVDTEQLCDRLEQHGDRGFLWVKRRLGDEEARAVRELKWPQDWLGFERELERRYPQDSLAGHVLGLRDIDGAGRGGIEQAFDPLLRGNAGWRVLARDARGKTLAVCEPLTTPPQPGASIVLTIDSVIQLFVEEALDEAMSQWQPASATAIVMDPRRGEILAMANRPTFNPNDAARAAPDAWTNRAISDAYEPGSTFKPFIMAAALDWGVVRLDEEIDCHNGVYRMGPRVLHSHHPNGVLTVPEVMIRSDNIGMAIVGERMTNDGLFRAVQSFGFGRATRIELPGESPGQVRPRGQWTPFYSTGSVPIGQELAVTPLQLITAFSAIANRGELLEPRVVRAVVAPDGHALELFDKPVVVNRPISAETARLMIESMLVRVVDDEKGTGRRARITGYSVFGKTGTAQLKAETGGYAVGRHVSSFVGGAPATDPQIVALVVVNDPSVGKEHYGGQVAAPVVKRILERSLVYLRVPPDREFAAAAATSDGDICGD